MSLRDANMKRMQQEGITYGERRKNDLNNTLQKNINDCSEKIQINNSVDVINVQIFQNGSEDTIDNALVIIIPSKYNLKKGDTITWNNSKWLCVKCETIYGVYNKGTIQECDCLLKFENPDKVLLEIPSVISQKLSLDLTKNQLITITDGVCEVYCTHNDTSKQIIIGTRFIIGTQVYIVTNLDDIHPIGILNIKMRLDDKVAEDNFNTGVAKQEYKSLIKSVDSEFITTASPTSTSTNKKLW